MFFINADRKNAVNKLQKVWMLAQRLKAKAGTNYITGCENFDNNYNREVLFLHNPRSKQPTKRSIETKIKLVHISHVSQEEYCYRVKMNRFFEKFERKRLKSLFSLEFERKLKRQLGTGCDMFCSEKILVGSHSPIDWKRGKCAPLQFGQLFPVKGQEICLYLAGADKHSFLYDLLID